MGKIIYEKREDRSLEEVLNEAIDSAKEQITEKNPTLENKEEVAKQVGVGAVVFHDLKMTV